MSAPALSQLQARLTTTLDCGAGGNFIDQNYTRMKGIKTGTLKEPIWVYNVDGTPNKWGTIRYYVDLKIEIHGRTRNEWLLVTGLGKHKIILGLPWLWETNPIIDWEKGTLEWREQETQKQLPVTISEEDDKEEYLNSTQNPLDKSDLAILVSSITGEMDNDIWINAKTSMAMEIQAELNQKQKDLPLEEQIPEEFHKFLEILKRQRDSQNLILGIIEGHI